MVIVTTSLIAGVSHRSGKDKKSEPGCGCRDHLMPHAQGPTGRLECPECLLSQESIRPDGLGTPGKGWIRTRPTGRIAGRRRAGYIVPPERP